MTNRVLLASFLLTATTACYYQSFKHSPSLAAASATEFAQVAFVEQNVDKAFSLLHPDFQAYGTKEKLSQVLTTMNTPTAPRTITTTDYEPVIGQEVMIIYLTGENGAEKFYYRILMKGTQ